MHIKEFHPEKLGLEYSCDKCGKKVKNQKCLIAHQRSHLTEKSFQCDFCSFRTYSQYLKNNHMKYNHADELGIEVKFYQCEHCGKNFKNRSNLDQHVESTHVGWI